jgi:two-component system, chemotaxis family, chemotaxis protein CheY
MEGSEGLWRARTSHFDAILADIHMPTMDGLELLRQLRRLPGDEKTPVFVLTSDVSRARFVEGREPGATAWLSSRRTCSRGSPPCARRSP